MRNAILLGIAVTICTTAAALAQSPGNAPTTSTELLALPVMPMAGDGNIILKFGETQRVYFPRSIKSMRLDDDLVVKLVPQSEHVVAITGLSPGRRTIRMTSGESEEFVAAVVTVASEPHPVRMFQGREINRVTGERRSDSTSAVGGYVTLNCNETRCAEVEPDLRPAQIR